MRRASVVKPDVAGGSRISIGARLPSALEVHAGVRPEGCCHLSFGLTADGISGGAKRLSQSPERGIPIELASVFRSVGLVPRCLLSLAQPTLGLRGLRLRARRPERMIHLSRYPQPVQQHGELACYRHHRALLPHGPAGADRPDRTTAARIGAVRSPGRTGRACSVRPRSGGAAKTRPPVS